MLMVVIANCSSAPQALHTHSTSPALHVSQCGTAAAGHPRSASSAGGAPFSSCLGRDATWCHGGRVGATHARAPSWRYSARSPSQSLSYMQMVASASVTFVRGDFSKRMSPSAASSACTKLLV